MTEWTATMHERRVIAAVLIGIVIVLTALAFIVGPPTSIRVTIAPLIVQTPPADIPLTSVLTGEDVSVRGFGPIPRCGDDSAVQAVIGILQHHSKVRVLGLSNIEDFMSAALPQRECGAAVESGEGKAIVHYRIAPLAPRFAGWQATVYADPASP